MPSPMPEYAQLVLPALSCAEAGSATRATTKNKKTNFFTVKLLL
jgi:hypothetical protein